MLYGVNPWRETYLTRDEVVRLLDAGFHWSVMYCDGSSLPPTSGHGPSLPAGVLERVPSEAAKRKLQRGRADKTYFRAELRHEDVGAFVRLVEDL
jgi:hypothetical protein